MVDVRTTILRATFAAGNFSSGTKLGMIAPAAAAPKASPTPTRNTASPKKICGVAGPDKKTIEKTITARARSDAIITCLRGKRSVQTPANGAPITDAKMREPKIKPRVVALPP